MRSKKLLRSQLAYVAILILLLSISAPSLMAQSAGTSALSGTITDPSGAAIPNVTVTITNNDNGQVRTATTGSDGVYKFNLLQPGNYKVRFSAAGFWAADLQHRRDNRLRRVSSDRWRPVSFLSCRGGRPARTGDRIRARGCRETRWSDGSPCRHR